MLGPYVLFLAIVWFAVACGIAIYVASRLPAGGWRVLVGVLAAALLFPLPLVDDIVGGVQFGRLCEENSAIHIDRKSAAGRTVYLADVRRRDVDGTWVHVVLTEWLFVDAKTGEIVVRYNTLAAGPGVVHFGGAPLTFKGSCAPAGRPASVETFRPFGINYVEPPHK
jgi:hypothetical protein